MHPACRSLLSPLAVWPSSLSIHLTFPTRQMVNVVRACGQRALLLAASAGFVFAASIPDAGGIDRSFALKFPLMISILDPLAGLLRFADHRRLTQQMVSNKLLKSMDAYCYCRQGL